MDQVKKALAVAKKHAFWIVSGLTVILAIVGYFLSRTSLDATFTAQATKIDSQYSTLQTISGELPTHPNEKSHVAMESVINELLTDVQAAWEMQYKHQEKILVWPADSLPRGFINKVDKLRPIELKLPYPPEKELLNDGEKVQYAKYFIDQFPRLAKIIGCEWVGTKAASGSAYGGAGGEPGVPGGSGSGNYDPTGGTGGYPGGDGGLGSGMPGSVLGVQKTPDLVTWPKAAQDLLLADVQMWKGERPRTHEVLYTQENIWILEGLLNIIARANGDAKANFQTRIKEIEFIRIGRNAVGKVGTIDRPQIAGMGGMGMGGMDGGMGSGGMDMGYMEGASPDMSSGGGAMEPSVEGTEGSMDGGMGGMGMPGMTLDPADRRYVDAAFTPLTGEDLRSKMQSSAPEDAYFAVAKRIPVRIRCRIDQRHIQNIMAEFGNASLLFEIRQVRYGKTAPAPAAGSGGGYGSDSYGSGGGSGGAPGSGVGMGSDGGMGGSIMGSEGSGGSGDMGMGGYGTGSEIGSTAGIWDETIEIYGIVYLFNPVDTAKLGLDKVNADTQIEDKADAPETPAAGATPPAGGSTPAAQPGNTPAPAGTAPPTGTVPAAGTAPPTGVAPPGGGAAPATTPSGTQPNNSAAP